MWVCYFGEYLDFLNISDYNIDVKLVNFLLGWERYGVEVFMYRIMDDFYWIWLFGSFVF